MSLKVSASSTTVEKRAPYRTCLVLGLVFLGISGYFAVSPLRSRSEDFSSVARRAGSDPTGEHVVLSQPGEGLQVESTLPLVNPLRELHFALERMQEHHFKIWLGTWPDAIDWTAAVLGTYLSASLSSLSRTLEYTFALSSDSTIAQEALNIENEVGRYFSQSVSYYFGENAFAIRTQAHDDMLWVVLGWLESIKFVNMHTTRHFSSESASRWYGKQFEEAFAHRARVFYDLASKGWETSLCGGGMIWNPHLKPYKNAITNELFMAASAGMYLHFPGDEISSPFATDGDNFQAHGRPRSFDPIYLKSAVDAYNWLARSNMTNHLGLYVDGFHIKGWGINGTIGSGRCDERNEMVYTYNQGVVLSGLRGLWESTGRRLYLEDGHTLIRNVIRATGWHANGTHSETWSGLGHRGVLEEVCDSFGTCTQNGQTFKGIFFHHLTAFCEPLPSSPRVPGKTFAASPAERMLHGQSCKEYAPWVRWNAHAALRTRNDDGDFGTWWGSFLGHSNDTDEESKLPPRGAMDYRNNMTLLLSDDWVNGLPVEQQNLRSPPPPQQQQSIARSEAHYLEATTRKRNTYGSDDDPLQMTDVNDRGRGRTVETQGGGIAVVRALWELETSYADAG